MVFNYKYKMTNIRTYKSWDSMKQRCLNKNCIKYIDYGGRGIIICEEWSSINGFENFCKDMGERPENRTLDRIDNNKNYCKENCRWATVEEQMNNRRNSRFITYKKKTQTVAQWSRELGICDKTIYYRLNNGWNDEKSLTISRN